MFLNTLKEQVKAQNSNGNILCKAPLDIHSHSQSQKEMTLREVHCQEKCEMNVSMKVNKLLNIEIFSVSIRVRASPLHYCHCILVTFYQVAFNYWLYVVFETRVIQKKNPRYNKSDLLFHS